MVTSVATPVKGERSLCAPSDPRKSRGLYAEVEAIKDSLEGGTSLASRLVSRYIGMLLSDIESTGHPESEAAFDDRLDAVHDWHDIEREQVAEAALTARMFDHHA